MLVLVVTALLALAALAPFLVSYAGRALGRLIRQRTEDRRQLLLFKSRDEEGEFRASPRVAGLNEDDEWEKVDNHPTRSAKNGDKEGDMWSGIVAFFHPFCNAGGGGERVLWAAIRATQLRYPQALCVVYTGDHDVNKTEILTRVQDRFNIHLHPPSVTFVYLSKRHFVLSSTWPHFTLLGQSIGSLILAWEAFTTLAPDIYIDTIGYAFTLALSKFLFPTVPTAAYIHYPTISTDMLSSLDEGGQGLNAGSGKGFRGAVKRTYWLLFAKLYGWVGRHVDVVMTNSSWTQSHIRALWGSSSSKSTDPVVVFPPVAVDEVAAAVPVDAASEAKRSRALLYIAQFRPEKNHTLILDAFAQFLHSNAKSSSSSSSSRTPPSSRPRLVLVGSVRNDEDSRYIYRLRLLVNELHVKDDVEFVLNASWPAVLTWLRRAWIGVNGMWNEHFGIGVVEYQAAGLIAVVNDSGGPKEDIVVEIEGKPTGFHATTADEYATAFSKALSLPPEEVLDMRQRARRSAQRFSEDVFEGKWLEQMARLVALQRKRQIA